MRRVLVTGNAGSGKSTVAAALAEILKLPYSGMDAIVWQPGWAKTPPPVRKAKEMAIANDPTWIVDGVSTILLSAADTVVFLDFPRYKCYWRVLKRNLPFLFRSRPGLPNGCPELLIIPALAKIIWRFPNSVRPMLLEAQESLGQMFVHIRSNSELQQFLDSVQEAGRSPAASPDAPLGSSLLLSPTGGPVTFVR